MNKNLNDIIAYRVYFDPSCEALEEIGYFTRIKDALKAKDNYINEFKKEKK